VPRDRACVYMSNHQSNVDIPILYSVFPGTLRMVAKAELFKVPLWGRAMKEAGFVRVTRSGDRAEAMAAMEECGRAIGAGVNVWIAPEGTRSLDGKVAKFKKGGFILARDTKSDIVPVAIDGSRDILPKNTRVIQRGARVRVSFGPPVAIGARDLNAVIAEVRQFIVDHVTEPQD
jgi:1-acyl-sn-glycerol-3-phosphate acyltransferase